MSKVVSKEEFSFTSIAKMPPSLPESPPMKRLNVGTRRSLSAGNLLEYTRNSTLDHMDKESEAEEKMDLLWENFNEELVISRTHFTEAEKKLHSKGSMKLSKSNVLMISSRRKSVVVVMKVLRKIFLIHNYQHFVKKL
ncbi:hypothetical protein LIER_20341 [Lithospermum erythrorhizon]|uniref:Uncharacterized protein n=1 Tax=Lithospermum erythrorhizon TaxID=34254 RepID=A0AAV3QNM1_LITER